MRHPKQIIFRSRTQKLIGLVLAMVLCGGILGLAAILAPVAGSAFGSPLLAQMATPTVSGELLCAKLYLVDPNLPPDRNRIQQERYQACLQGYNTRLTPKPQTTLERRLAAPHTIAAPTANVPRTPAGAGTIIENQASPLGPLYVIENSWIIEDQGIATQVFAGAKREEGPPQPRGTMQGIVVVWVSATQGQIIPPTGYYNIPVRNGPVRITGAQGQRLTLQADDGTIFYFDVPARQFVSGLSVTVTPVEPTASPSP